MNNHNTNTFVNVWGSTQEISTCCGSVCLLQHSTWAHIHAQPACVSCTTPPLLLTISLPAYLPAVRACCRRLLSAPVLSCRPTEKVDVFAFGVVLYELLSRKLVAASVADVCARNASNRRGSKHKHAKAKGSGTTTHHSKGGQQSSSSRQQAVQHGGTDAGGDADGAAGGDSDSSNPAVEQLPEPQLLLSYAQLVAGGYRPPMLPHFPEPVRALIRACWAAEPHERPRMAEVLAELQAWSKNRPLLSALNAYVLALADMGYVGTAAPEQPTCGCVIS